ncbi:two component, sigma54 specific, transcriptional regulator, Fis family [Denitrovibrio acetiphilus DSM 12809]|uniref:Two component, sigma54 specific, transcriptional regulator, Fis family n=1 Tax=Denitrovibrio acetiphilus (strain DSM 12809 / NBRC 114555 / N2460) TaxID=522772 RepID=D4H2I0_DENA2|nr:sigma-54 dependent transcriptional regulator [Denitrovibrio acetiphilus]ADD67041.1 two component, sigma54 specific, transcriptional regulator, Fis family [Denitrovibrio acetiphilus DSM 12809]
MTSILLVDDERDWLVSFRRTLLQYDITSSENIRTAQREDEVFDILEKEDTDLVFLDLMLGDVSGKDVLHRIKQKFPHLPVIIMTGVNDIHMALNCGKLGAMDYMVKTSLIEELISNIKRIIKIHQLEKENHALKDGLFSISEEFPVFKDFITKSSRMHSVFKYLTALAVSPYPILITGESGVGKGVLAKATAELSRPGRPFVSINVSGLDDHAFSDTLFGHRKGAFTGADSNRPGAIQKADDGTLFLDEIGDLPNTLQVKLLYLAQDGEYQQLGSDAASKSRARLIFATNQNLEDKCRAGEFRQDLYYRLNTHFVHIPPLRERPEDIQILFHHFISQASQEFQRSVPEITQDALDLISAYSFPGNTRQLRAICFDVLARTQNKIQAKDLQSYLTSNETKIDLNDSPLPKVDEVIDQLICDAMKLAGNNQTKAAAMIGISQSTLSRRLRK